MGGRRLIVSRDGAARAGGRAGDRPLIVAFGAGQDSTGMLIAMVRRRIRPDLILFADTGG